MSAASNKENDIEEENDDKNEDEEDEENKEDENDEDEKGDDNEEEENGDDGDVNNYAEALEDAEYKDDSALFESGKQKESFIRILNVWFLENVVLIH